MTIQVFENFLKAADREIERKHGHEGRHWDCWLTEEEYQTLSSEDRSSYDADKERKWRVMEAEDNIINCAHRKDSELSEARSGASSWVPKEETEWEGL